ncbi:iron-containing redox enzyme family protein [Micromonospora sp. R77]|uniref:iron-containing redox enzyme family protein n=1 Tax=Micromonospora sp. R77 TaxID=2925836 RepID=UPI001F61053E|nr:iron-containing redox enzyme family protein [Micromonospora sp. R77]MCI4061051.1 iron-containing redox enzyme family protein [Micromonospora sp. R77]
MAALVGIQMDEYGDGRLDRMHAELFRVTVQRLDLDTGYAAHLDRVPAVNLATNNLISLFTAHLLDSWAAGRSSLRTVAGARAVRSAA